MAQKTLALLLVIVLFIAGCIASEAKNITEQKNNETKTNVSVGNVSQKAEKPPETVTETKTCKELSKGESGMVLYGDDVYFDKCYNETAREKQVCAGGKRSTTIEPCKSGYSCLDGACTKIQPKCTDSDGGKNYNETGTVSYLGTSYTDTCTGIRNLKENYCLNDQHIAGLTECDGRNRCVNGHCELWPLTCTQKTNSTQIDYHDGEIEIRQDNCNSTSKLVKNYCVEGMAITQNITCSDNQWCSPKTVKCEKNICEGSKSPNKYAMSHVSYGSQKYYSKCISDSILKAYFCSSEGSGFEYVNLECGLGCRGTHVEVTDPYTGEKNDTLAGYCNQQ